VIIFAGVYGAFWVEGYQQALEDRAQAEKVLEALHAELSLFRTTGPSVEAGMREALSSWEEARARGEAPPPGFYQEPGAETPSVSVWEATLYSGGINLLEPELFFALASFYNRVESTSERYIRYNTVTEREILPLLSRGPGVFYDSLTGDLDPSYRVHMDQLRTIADEVKYLLVRADTLVKSVQGELEEIR
jgi:hypothetical protein